MKVAECLGQPHLFNMYDNDNNYNNYSNDDVRSRRGLVLQEVVDLGPHGEHADGVRVPISYYVMLYYVIVHYIILYHNNSNIV